MKRILMQAAMALCWVSYGQHCLEEGMAFEKIGEIWISKTLYVSCGKSNDMYCFEYADASSKEKSKMSFRAGDKNGEFEKLYHFIMQGNPKVPCRASKVPMTVDDIWLEFTKSRGEVHVRFLQNIGSKHVSYSAWLTKTEINILFGKG